MLASMAVGLTLISCSEDVKTAAPSYNESETEQRSHEVVVMQMQALRTG